MPRRRLFTLLTTLALALSGVGISVASAGPAQAASCTRQTGTAKRDPNTGWTWTTWWVCGNDAGARMYREPNTTTLTAYMDSTSSWFVCWKRGAQHAGGNNVWYYSKGDRSAPGQSGRQAWGYMPAVNVHTSTDPWPGMAECPSTTPPPPTGPPARGDGFKTVILLHGFDRSSGVNCDQYWGNGAAVNHLRSRGWSAAQIVKLTYYTGGGLGCFRIPNAGNITTGIDELARDFAWYVYNTYSSKRQPIDVIAHSMGGLVTRAAIAGTANRRTTQSGRSFPPYLYIEDVATLSSPYEGARALAGVGCDILSPTVPAQCQQMKPGSSFLSSWIHRPAGSRVGYDNPQSAMGTDWSALGSGDDWVVATGSALNVSATYHYGHKYIYLSGSGLDHGQMSNIAGGSYALRYCDHFSACNMATWAAWPQTTASPGPISVAASAVYYVNGW
jgi:pimeloyl-ACP methyl ester carboxylesterase